MKRKITKKEIYELDKQIDSIFYSSKIFSVPLNKITLKCLQHFDEQIISWSQNIDQNNGRTSLHLRLNAFNHVIKACFDKCPKTEEENSNLEDEEINKGLQLLFNNSIIYQYLWVHMTSAHKEMRTFSKLGVNNFEIELTSFENEGVEQARRMISAAGDPKNPVEAGLFTENEVKRIRRYFSEKKTSTKDLILFVKQIIEKKSPKKWEMNPSWDLGGYNFAEYKRFWNTLEAFARISLVANNKTLVQLKNEKTWIAKLSTWSNLHNLKVEKIIADLIYDGNSHVMFTPFFKLRNGQLALSNSIVQISNAERNIWSLIGKKRTSIHDNLKNLKETKWINDLIPKLERLGLECFPNLKCKNNGKVAGNIDILILDLSKKYALACELKWLTFSDDVTGVEGANLVMSKGTQQAFNSIKWIDNNLSNLSNKINISIEKLFEIDFKPLVLIKEGLPSGNFKPKKEVPVINEKLLNWVLFSPHHRDIKSLWKIAKNQNYLPKEGKHYKLTSIELEFGQLKFKFNNVQFEQIKMYDPKKDIVF